MIWAQSRTGVIGRDGTLPWRLPEDMAHFRELTDEQPVIMGRRTWESLPARFRPLPGRRTIVLTGRSGYQAPGAEVVGSLAEAVRLAGADRDGTAWLAGGADVYAAGARELASVAHVTEVDIDVPGDTYAPSLTGAGWVVASTGDWLTSSTGLRYRFLRYHREQRH
jgi:dihydrofolate reductase